MLSGIGVITWLPIVHENCANNGDFHLKFSRKAVYNMVWKSERKAVFHLPTGVYLASILMFNFSCMEGVVSSYQQDALASVRVEAPELSILS